MQHLPESAHIKSSLGVMGEAKKGKNQVHQKEGFLPTLYHYQKLRETSYSRCLAVIFPNFNYFYIFYNKCLAEVGASFVCVDRGDPDNVTSQKSMFPELTLPVLKCDRNAVLMNGVCYYTIITYSVYTHYPTQAQADKRKCKSSVSSEHDLLNKLHFTDYRYYSHYGNN